MRHTHDFIRRTYLRKWTPVSPATFGKPAPQAHLALRVFGLTSVVLLFAFFALLGLTGFAAWLFYANLTSDLPSPEKLAKIELTQSTRIYDRNGDLLFELFDPQGGRRTIVTADQIPPVMKEATIATEDPTFYTNSGVDWYAILRALYYNLRYQSTVSGGSTITQQVVKNSLLSSEPTLERKIREAALAIEVNRRYSKDEILALYLNTNNFGNLSYGIQAAARGYFNKDVSELNLAEASLLAGLPQAPARYDPCINPDAALARQEVVLGLMEKTGYITEKQSAAARREMAARLQSDDFERNCNLKTSIKAPHFVNYVRADLEKRFGPDVVYKGGLQVYTTFDPAVQAIAEEEARKQIAALKDKHVTNAAVVVLKTGTGEIEAMLGSVDFFDKSIDGQVNVADRLRQPGSSIKPINYVTAFKYGWTPATRILDLKTKFPDATGKPYEPINYDEKEHGLLTVRQALGSSLNIPAVKTLFFTSAKNDMLAPYPLAMIRTAQQMGITTFTNPDGSLKQFGLALTLGGGDVKLIELAGAYSVFANQGAYIAPTPYLKIVDGKGNVLYDLNGKDKPRPRCPQFDLQTPNEQPDANGFCARSAPYAYLITNILSDDNARTIGFGRNSILKTPYPSAVKTGTTNDFRDNWTLGYTTDWVVGVWVGNSDNSQMKNSTGITGAAPIWRQVMDRLSQPNPPKEFPLPPGIVRLDNEVFVEGHEQTEPDREMVITVRIDRRTGLIANDTCEPEFVETRSFEAPPKDLTGQTPYEKIVDWARKNGWNAPPTQTSPLCGTGGWGPPLPDEESNVVPGATYGSRAPTFISTGDPEASVRGHVKDRLGRPVIGLRMVLFNNHGPVTTATTGIDGGYDFDGLLPGTYGVRIASDPNSASVMVYVDLKRRALFDFTVK